MTRELSVDRACEVAVQVTVQLARESNAVALEALSLAAGQCLRWVSDEEGLTFEEAAERFCDGIRSNAFMADVMFASGGHATWVSSEQQAFGSTLQ